MTESTTEPVGGILAKIREKGLSHSASVGLALLRQRAASTRGRGEQYLLLSPHVDVTGAPQVLLGVIDELAMSVNRRQIRLLTPHVWPDQLERLNNIGIQIDRTADVIGPRFITRQLGLRRTDFVLMNSAAVSPRYRRVIVRLLGSGQLSHALWLIHEDVDQLEVVAPDLVEPKQLARVSELVDRGQLEVFVPSRRTKAEYDRLFHTTRVKTLRLRVEVPEELRPERPDDAYRRLDFLLTGTAKDGRKGQLIALFAFQRFMRLFYEANPRRYREFSLTLVGLGEDYVSDHCRLLGTDVLGSRLRLFPVIPREESLEITRSTNAVICCSLNEAFPLYIGEAMAMGHVVVRNDVSGAEEQLVDGGNGYRIDSRDLAGFAEVIETMLNKETTSDQTLHSMGRMSRELIDPYLRSSYSAQLLGH